MLNPQARAPARGPSTVTLGRGLYHPRSAAVSKPSPICLIFSEPGCTHPMIRSMTGFARREVQAPWGKLSCELRTVNHRYLEVSLRLPEELKAFETEARQAIGAALR